MEHEADQGLHVGLSCGLLLLVHVFECQGDRLFDDNMLARLGGRDGVLRMQVVRGADHNDIYFFPSKHRSGIGVNGALQIVPFRVPFGIYPVMIDQSAHLGACVFLKGFNVLFGHCAAPNNRYAELIHILPPKTRSPSSVC